MIMKKKIIVGTNTILETAKQMWLRGEITAKQYSEMKERNENLSNEVKKDIIELTGEWVEMFIYKLWLWLGLGDIYGT